VEGRRGEKKERKNNEEKIENSSSLLESDQKESPVRRQSKPRCLSVKKLTAGEGGGDLSKEMQEEGQKRGKPELKTSMDLPEKPTREVPSIRGKPLLSGRRDDETRIGKIEKRNRGAREGRRALFQV